MILPLLVALSSQLLAPTSKNFPETSEAPMVEQAAPVKVPNATRAPRLAWKPGLYALESLKLPETLTMESFEQWSGGPNWPSVEAGVVVVTDSADDPMRFMAFLVDTKLQRIAAVRDGDKAKHLMTVGQIPPAKGDGSAVPAERQTSTNSRVVPDEAHIAASHGDGVRCANVAQLHDEARGPGSYGGQVEMRKKLTNDVGATLVLSSAAAPANGTTEFVAGGVRYLPAANFNGTDAFTYEVCGNDGCDHILRVTDGSDHHGIYRPEDRDDAVSAALTPFATRDKTRGDGSMKSIRGRWLAPATALAIAVGAGAAIAGIPAADGTINGCYDKQSGQLRLTDPETGTPKSCGAKEIAVQWNQTGPQGETGHARSAISRSATCGTSCSQPTCSAASSRATPASRPRLPIPTPATTRRRSRSE